VNRKQYNNAVKKYSDKLYAFCLKMLGNEDEAKDIVQESYERLWLNLEKVASESAKSFLYKTAYNMCIDIKRKLKVKQQFEKEMKYQISNTFTNENFDLFSHIDKALSLLPDIQRTVLLLRDFENYSYAEIGEITSLSESQVKVYIYRARKAVKNFFEKLEKVK
jgi:RNA polymerase sigma factor (sigma-70 family)